LRKTCGTGCCLRKREGRSSSSGLNLSSSMCMPLGTLSRVDLHWVMVCSLGQTSRYIPISWLILTNEYSPDFFDVSQPLSATLRRPTSPSSRAPVSQSPTPTEPPPSLLFRLVPQLRPVPRIVTSDSSAHPLETRQPHNSILTVSVMIAMPTPPTLHSSGDTIPPIQIGVTHLPVPHGLTTDAKTLSA
jgi:hypothetical protein